MKSNEVDGLALNPLPIRKGSQMLARKIILHRHVKEYSHIVRGFRPLTMELTYWNLIGGSPNVVPASSDCFETLEFT